VIHINTVKQEIPVDLLFVSNSKKARSNPVMPSDIKVICTSNISDDLLRIDYKVDYSSLLGNGSEVDNAGLMFLSLLAKIGVNKVTIAGFDGFTYDPEDYLDFVSTSYMQRNLDYRNSEITRELHRISQMLEIEFLTPSLYNLRSNH
jgi:4-hydroxy 2-oxovalerate aldolase